MLTWKELDEEFSKLDGPIRHAQIHYQWGGPDGYLAELRGAGLSEVEKTRFENLATIAGKKLSEVAAKSLDPMVWQAPEGLQRWYASLANDSGLMKLGHRVESVRQGQQLPTTYTGRVSDPARASAALALQMSHLPVSWWAWIKARKITIGSVAAALAILGYFGVHPWWVRTVAPPLESSQPTPVRQAPLPSSAPVTNSATIAAQTSVQSQNQSGGITAQTVNITNASQPAPVPAPKPDLALKFVEPSWPALVIENQSDAIARDIKWQVWFLDIDGPRDGKGILQPLPIPIASFDWLRPHDRSGLQALFTPLVMSRVKPGDRIYGSAMVLCPECKRSRSYLVYIKFGESGWFVEDKKMKDGEARFPRASDEEREAFVREIDQQTASVRHAIE
ncbi:MAG TPA: hypothetical protein VMF03_13920 [Steroidobacteraceae bacterium]|nr:hypothetical protein [Steroidobacteraceae bacterium]